MPTQSPASWQNPIDPKLVQRLMRPIDQPGVIGSALADQIQARAERWSNRLPLLTQVAQRHTQSEAAPEEPPIVYAQPVSAKAVSDAGHSSPPSAPASDRPTVIQAKFAPSALADPLDSSTAPELPLPSNQPLDTSQHPIASENPSPTPLPIPIVQARSPAVTSNSAALPQLQFGSRLPIGSAQSVSPHSTTSPLRVGEPQMQVRELTQKPRLKAPLPERRRGWGEGNSNSVDPSRSNGQRQVGQSAPSNFNAIEPAKVELAKVEPAKVEAAGNDRSPLPVVRSHAPAPKLHQDLVFAPTPRSINSASPGLTTATPPPSVVRTIATQTTSSQGTGANFTAAQSNAHSNTQLTAPSIVREITVEPPLQPSLQPSQRSPTPQAIVSRAEPPPLDVDALADKVERKLARRMAIERERRGWTT